MQIKLTTAFLLLPCFLAAQTTIHMGRGTFNAVPTQQEDGYQNPARTANTVDGLGRQRYAKVVMGDGSIAFYDRTKGYIVDSMYQPPKPQHQQVAPQRPHIDATSPKVKNWPLEALGVNALNGSLTGRGVSIAICDSGTTPHEQFLPGMIDVLDVTGTNNPGDEYGHGTAITGIIAGSGAGESGFRGIAPGAKIKAYRIANKTGLTDSTYIQKALDYIAEYNVKNPNNKISILNISYGLNNNHEDLKAALRRAFDSGITIIAPSGNSGVATLTYPAAYDFVVAVGAINYHKKPLADANFGAGLAVVAPGSGIFAPDNYNDYEWVRGTSFASAYITGVAALISEAYKTKYGRLPTPQEVYVTLQKISVNLADVPQYKQGFGLPDVTKIAAAI